MQHSGMGWVPCLHYMIPRATIARLKARVRATIIMPGNGNIAGLTTICAVWTAWDVFLACIRMPVSAVLV